MVVFTMCTIKYLNCLNFQGLHSFCLYEQKVYPQKTSLHIYLFFIHIFPEKIPFAALSASLNGDALLILLL